MFRIRLTMTTKISEMYGKPIYSGKGQKIGSVKDVIIDTEEGKTDRLVIEEMKGLNKGQLKQLIKEKSVDYDKVKSAGDIILLRGIGEPKRARRKSKQQKTSKSQQGSFGSFINQ